MMTPFISGYAYASRLLSILRASAGLIVKAALGRLEDVGIRYAPRVCA